VEEGMTNKRDETLPIVIGVSGYKRSGKDTVGKYITDHFKRFERYAFADPVREAAMAFFGWSLEYMTKHKEEIDPFWGISPRQALQYIGTEVGRDGFASAYKTFRTVTGNELWIKRFEKHVYSRPMGTNFVITDMRFHNEFESVAFNDSFRAFTIGVIRPGTGGNDSHASEAEIGEVVERCDHILHNDDELTVLYQRLNQIMHREGLY
jgi:hypothetical protein